eukprot:373555_1
MAQHKLLVYGYVRLEFNQEHIASIKQLCHEFYHKNVIVYQSQKDDPTIEEYKAIEVGGFGGGGYKYVSKERKLLVKLRVADLTLYNEDGISIQGYQFESQKMQKCVLGKPPDGIRKKRTIKLKTKQKEYCNGVEIFYGGSHDGIRGIKFITNYEREIMIGKTKQSTGKIQTWKSTKLLLPHKQYGIIGFQGRSGWLLDQISFVFAPQ